MDDKTDFLENLLYGEVVDNNDITERQWKILEAAIRIFSEKGFEASRTSDIAKEADVAEGTIFRYYRTKKELLSGLMFPLVSKFFKPLIMQPVEEIMKNEDNRPIEEVMEDVLLDRINLANKNLPLVKTMLIESLYHLEILEPLREKIMPQVIDVIENFIKQNIKSGEFRDIDPRIITRTAMSVLSGYLILTHVYPNSFPIETDEEEIKKMIDILLYGISNRKVDYNA